MDNERMAQIIDRISDLITENLEAEERNARDRGRQIDVSDLRFAITDALDRVAHEIRMNP